MKLYNGIPLPALPGYNESVYTHGFIQYGGVAGMEIYNLIVSTASGVMGDSYTVGEHTYSAWVVAANETAAENLSGAYPGISTKEWLQFEDGNTVTASTYDNIVWSNFDILKADGSVYLKASKPFDLDAFKIGLSLGLCGKALPWKAEPVAWLYNGVRLPKLPEWDKETYPYAFMTVMATSSNTSAYLYCSPVPIYKNDNGGLISSLITKQDGTVICYTCSLLSDGTVFEDWTRYENGDKSVVSDASFIVINTALIKWSNYDMLNYSDDSVYLAASEPVPVYD